MQNHWIKNLALLCILHFAFCTAVFAAPHITHLKPEPFPAKIGKHLSERMRAKSLAPMLANATLGMVKVVFLKVDFQNNTDSTIDQSFDFNRDGKIDSLDDLNNDGIVDSKDYNLFYVTRTTGDGTWSAPIYAYNGTSDYWVNKDKSGFINYYNEVSYGQLTLNVSVFPAVPGAAYRLPHKMAYYGTENSTDLENLIRDSVAQAKAVEGTNINFSQFDAILIIHAGPGEETDTAGNTPNDIWSMFYSTSTGIVTADGKTFNEAIIMPQTGTQDGTTVDPLGIYVHEFGHYLGLPDLYDTAIFPQSDGIGKWGLMGDGIYNVGADGIQGSSPAHLDAWCKAYLGWVTPQEFLPPSDPGFKTLAPIEVFGNSNQVFKLQAGASTTSQYYLLENRQRTGFDYGLPGSGLLVWLINEDVINTNIGANQVNNFRFSNGVVLVEADGDKALMTYGGDDGSAGDPFPGSLGKTSFTPYTNPSSTPYLGAAWLYLKNIAVSGSNVSATIGFAPNVPSGLAASHNSATVLSWTANTEADLAGYKVYRNSTFLAETTQNQNQYTDMTSANGDTYTLTAVDSNGYESAKSTPATVSFVTSGGGGGSSSGGCFIATAAYGSYEAPYVKILREFRDSYLISNLKLQIANFKIDIPNILGSGFVRLYYKFSPPIADFIRESEGLRALVRVLLLPLIGMAAFLVKTTFLQKCIAFGVLIIGQAFIVHILHRPLRVTQIED